MATLVNTLFAAVCTGLTVFLATRGDNPAFVIGTTALFMFWFHYWKEH